MSKFHSTVSRRDFMKALGFGAGAVAATGAAIPAFKDLDDMVTSTPQKQHPWWVKERDYDDITTDVDWSVFKAYNNAVNSGERANDVVAPNMNVYDKNTAQRDSRRAAGRPGFTIRDRALTDIFTGMSTAGVTIAPNDPVVSGQKWNVNPEDNFTTLQAALHWIGSESVGAFTLNDKTKRLYNLTTTFDGPDGQAHNSINLQFDAKWVISFGTHQNYEQKRLELITADDNQKVNGHPTDLGRASVYRAYNDAQYAEHQFMRFITGLGWYASSAGQGPNVPFGIFAGNGEQSRTCHLMTPHYGIMTRRTISYTTNMPLAPQKPIDFGGTRFCKTCRRCAEKCPTDAMGDDKYTETNYDTVFGQRPGFKGWRIDWALCKTANAPSYCGSCHGLCPFNHQSEALIHPLVRFTAAQTSLFNRFFGFGDRLMHYAEPQTDDSMDAWWHRNLKTYKGDTILNGGLYKWAL